MEDRELEQQRQDLIVQSRWVALEDVRYVAMLENAVLDPGGTEADQVSHDISEP